MNYRADEFLSVSHSLLGTGYLELVHIVKCGTVGGVVCWSQK